MKKKYERRRIKCHTEKADCGVSKDTVYLACAAAELYIGGSDEGGRFRKNTKIDLQQQTGQGRKEGLA